MKVKTSDLIGPTLNWAVAKCESEEQDNIYIEDGTVIHARWIGEYRVSTITFNPSKNWAQGGPIIERERFYLQPGPVWYAMCSKVNQPMLTRMSGQTPLIAAMRCYVASKLGDTVDIPEELLK